MLFGNIFALSCQIASLDTDGDRITNDVDADDDNDGIPDAVEGVGNLDSDGLPDSQDLDSDNDGINDVNEAGGLIDADGNGLADGTDSDGDGMIDSNAVNPVDSDRDGRADYKDLDSDNDTLSDLVEGNSGAIDINDDGVADGPDADSDGIVDSVDGDNTNFGDSDVSGVLDQDNDTIPNYIDLDSDDPTDINGNGNDDDIDVAANSQLDVDGDGRVDNPFDPDSDGIANNSGLDELPNQFGGLGEFEDIPRFLTVCYIPDARCSGFDCGYTIDGIRMMNHSVPKLLNSVNFGPFGAVPCRVRLAPIHDTITEDAIDAAGCNVFFVGAFGSAGCNLPEISDIPSTELQAIRSWSTKSPDNLAIVSQQEAVEWGYTPSAGNINPNVPAPSGATSEIFDGPFGQVNQLNQGGCYQGNFSAGPETGSTVYAVDSSIMQKETMLIDHATHDIILGDFDMLTDLGAISFGGTITTQNDILFVNIFASACQNKAP